MMIRMFVCECEWECVRVLVCANTCCAAVQRQSGLPSKCATSSTWVRFPASQPVSQSTRGVGYRASHFVYAATVVVVVSFAEWVNEWVSGAVSQSDRQCRNNKNVARARAHTYYTYILCETGVSYCLELAASVSLYLSAPLALCNPSPCFRVFSTFVKWKRRFVVGCAGLRQA